MNDFLAALQFITVFPVKRNSTPAEIGRSTVYFPVVGLIFGGILAALAYCLNPFLQQSLLAIILLVILTGLSGAIHLDGVVDTFDGLAGHRTPEKRLEIMRDSRVGGFGVIGAVLVIMAKFVALNSIPAANLVAPLIVTIVVSRWAMVFSIWAFPYARPEGLGKAYKDATKDRQMLLATIVMLFIVFPFWQISGLIVAGVVLLITALLNLYLKGKLSGLTGDTYGAVNEIAEVVALTTASILIFNHWF